MSTLTLGLCDACGCSFIEADECPDCLHDKEVEAKKKAVEQSRRLDLFAAHIAGGMAARQGWLSEKDVEKACEYARATLYALDKEEHE